MEHEKGLSECHQPTVHFFNRMAIIEVQCKYSVDMVNNSQDGNKKILSL